MNKNTQIGLWSAAGLIGTLIIAWYFSRKQNIPAAVSEKTTAPDAGTTNAGNPNYTFNIPPISIPKLTMPTFPTLPTGTTSAPVTKSCCQRCTSDNDISGGKILSSGNFINQTFAATKAATSVVKTAAVISPPSYVLSPKGPMLIKQYNGGLPLPAKSWWDNDSIYRQAYVTAYNQTLEKAQTTGLYLSKEFGIRMYPLDYSLANTNYSRVADTVSSAGQEQQTLVTAQALSRHSSPGLGDESFLRSTSDQMNQWMQIALTNALMAFGDPNVLGGSSTIGSGIHPQQIFTIQ